ncbi:MAG: serine hydrolase domain-containing protein [Actinomycetota bacterium]
MSDWMEHLSPQLESTVATFVTKHRLPGAATGLVHGDELVWSFGYGFADVEDRRRPDARTLFRIASITKTFTGTAILQLRDEGELSLDDPVVEHVPELRSAAAGVAPIERVTIRGLLSHESGLLGDPPGADWATGEYEGTFARTVERVGEIGVRIPPFTLSKYSNLGYQILGEVVARTAGMPYQHYLRDSILEPLGMSSTVFEPLPPELTERLATGYAARWLSDELSLARENPIVWAEGGLISCVEDLARWISFQFREDGSDRAGAQVLAGSTLREMHTPRYLSNETWTEAFALSWYAVRRGDVIWTQHSGGLYGFITNVCFRVEDRLGAIVLLNGNAEAADLAMDLAELALTEVRRIVEPAKPPAPMPEAFASLIGLYLITEESLVIRLEWRDGRLELRDPDSPEWHPTLEPTDDPDVFVIRGFRGSGEPAVFERDADGRVRTMKMGPETLRRLDLV